MLKNKLEQLNTELVSFKEKLKKRLGADKQSLQETTLKLNEANHKLELSLKEQKDNEAVLEQLLKEMGELEESL